MKKYILGCIIFLSTAAPCFAGWPEAKDMPETNETMTQAERLMLLAKRDGQFYISDKPSKGFKVVAFDSGTISKTSSMIALRHFENKVDYIFMLFSPLSDSSCSLYLDLLDGDRFLIQSIFISNLAKGYEGTLYGNFAMNWATFQNVKYYRISIKS